MGHLALWETDIYEKFKNDYYVNSDSDVVPVPECPDNFMELFLATLNKYPLSSKVGFSLRIDNLPDTYKYKKEVIEWESAFYQDKKTDQLYRAPIDTTFALYRPRTKGGSNGIVPMYRTAYPYQAEHLPWYINTNNMTEEDIFYHKTTQTNTMWTIKNHNGPSRSRKYHEQCMNCRTSLFCPPAQGSMSLKLHLPIVLDSINRFLDALFASLQH